MCGRTACTLAPDVLCQACTYRNSGGGDGGGKHKKPRWRDHPPSKESGPGSYTYYPSTNAAPTRFTPVLMTVPDGQQNAVKKEVTDEEEEDEAGVTRQIMPMMFGMIPHYHKGTPKNHGLSTNNCRLEGLLESKLYKRSWIGRKFCVVLCQGFYEWKTTDVGEAKGVKRQPYLIYAPQKPGVSVVDEDQWSTGVWTEDNGWEGPELLKMAALYDVWKCSSTGDEVYSYTIITMESNDTLQWLHHRMPAILDTEEKVERWLGARELKLSNQELIDMLQPVKLLQWHPVAAKVGNSRCHDTDCMQEVKPEEKAKPKNTFMDKWLKKGTPTPGTVKIKREPEEDAPISEEKTDKKRARTE